MPNDSSLADLTVPITGRRLTLPAGPIFHLQRADEARHELGEFRAWAGYKNLGSDIATGDLVHFQHVVSCAATEQAGRTGVHAHLAHAHIVIPTSGRGVFSYDGVETVAEPGAMIVQHGGTVHDQFEYSYAPSSFEENCKTKVLVERQAPGAPAQSFSFLELFVPRAFANVEIVPPKEVTPQDQATAWDHPYHLAGARFFIQPQDAPDAVYRPVAGSPGLEARDAGTWEPSAHLVATWIVRPKSAASSEASLSLDIPGETGGVEIFYMVAGAASFRRDMGETIRLDVGDTCTVSQGALGAPFDCTPDMRLLRFFIAARAQDLRERTPEEIRRLEELGAGIIQQRTIRPAGDARPVNVLRLDARD